ncbi:MAG: HNH endonuclease [Chitinophagaceae bacterium]|nr:HNH endonuclease [Chitinophagaceae bacterium]
MGSVVSLHKRNFGKIIKPRIDRGNYFTVRLCKQGITSTKYVHRLLAEAFIPNPLSKCCVNHINGEQWDNSLYNLEWTTHSENMKHAYQIGLCKSAQSKSVEDKCSGKKYNSIKEAAIDCKLSYTALKGYLKNDWINPTCLKLTG